MSYYHFTLLSEAISPIVQGAGTAGNEQLVTRFPVELPTGRVEVPGLSGNSLRNRCLRTPLAEHLEATHSLTGGMTRDLLYFLYRGGVGGSAPVVRPEVRATFRRLLPLVRLLGGQGAGGQMLPGDIVVSHAALVCRENASILAGLLSHRPGLYPAGARFKSFGEYLGGWQEVGSDPATRRPDSLHPDHRGEAGFEGMPYGGECLVPGSWFLHRVTLPAEPVLGGAVAFALGAWQAGGGGIGGGTARGRGRLVSRIHCQGPDCEIDPGSLIPAYLEHTEGNHEAVIALLNEHYPLTPPTRDKKPAGRKGRGAKAAAATAEEVAGGTDPD